MKAALVHRINALPSSDVESGWFFIVPAKTARRVLMGKAADALRP